MISSLPFEYPEFPGGKERIMNQEPKKPLFGEAFSEAWLQLKHYLDDLDPTELRQLQGADETETLRFLDRQPQLGRSAALGSASGDPVSLAIQIVRERLDALEQDLDETGPSWGAEFLGMWRRSGFPLSAFSYDAIQEIKTMDRKTCLDKFVKKGLISRRDATQLEACPTAMVVTELRLIGIRKQAAAALALSFF